MTASGQFRFPSCCAAYREVDLELVAGDRDRDADLELAPACRLERVGGLEASVRKPRDRRPHDTLRVVVQLVHRRLDGLLAAPLAELVQPPLREVVRRELGAQVAAALVGVAHARDELAEDVVVEARRRDHDALLVELGASRLAGCRARPPTSAWWARVTAKPARVRVTSVMSGRCVPPAKGSLRIQASPGAGSCARRRPPRRGARRGGRGCARPGRPSARARRTAPSSSRAAP